MNIYSYILAQGSGFVLFYSPNIGELKAANDPPVTYCDWCKGFGRVMGNRLCGYCGGTGICSE